MVKMKAGMLPYVLLISFVVVLMSSMLLLAYYYNGRMIDDIAIRQAIKSHCQNAVLDQVYETGTFSDSKPEWGLSVARDQWGAYTVYRADAGKGVFAQSYSVITGVELDKKSEYCLYLANRPLSPFKMSGSAFLRGKVALPKARKEEVSFNNTPFTGYADISDEAELSNDRLPEIAQKYFQFSAKLKALSASETELQKQPDNQLLSNSFSNNELVIGGKSVVELEGLQMSGKIVVKADSLIRLHPSAMLDNVVLQAPYVHILAGFEGSVHVFAENEIVVEKACRLLLPSSLFLMASENDSAAYIRIQSNSTVAGAVVLHVSGAENKNKYISIEPASVVYGQVYTNSYLKLHSNVFASVYAHKLLLDTYKGSETNLLYNSGIDVTQIPDEFLGADLFGRKKKQAVLKTVY